jgi:CheY-like chemotaxis protein
MTAHEIGMDDYVTKPVRESNLHHLLGLWTALSSTDEAGSPH